MQPTSPRPHLLEQGGKAGSTGIALWALVPPSTNTPSGPRPHLPALYTPAQTLPSLPGKPAWEMGRDVQRYRKRTVVPQCRADFLPWRRRTSLPGNQGVARPALHPLKAGTQSSSPHQPRRPCQDGTFSQTDLERNVRVLYLPHTAATFPTECGLGPHSDSQSAARNLLLSLRATQENIHLPQRGLPPDWGSGEGGPYICLQCDPMKPGGCPHALYSPQAGL